jgi:hypothetical protein
LRKAASGDFKKDKRECEIMILLFWRRNDLCSMQDENSSDTAEEAHTFFAVVF